MNYSAFEKLEPKTLGLRTLTTPRVLTDIDINRYGRFVSCIIADMANVFVWPCKISHFCLTILNLTLHPNYII